MKLRNSIKLTLLKKNWQIKNCYKNLDLFELITTSNLKYNIYIGAFSIFLYVNNSHKNQEEISINGLKKILDEIKK